MEVVTGHLPREGRCDSSLKMISVPVTLVFAQNAILGGHEKKRVGLDGAGATPLASYLLLPKMLPKALPDESIVLSDIAEYKSFDCARIGSLGA